MDGVGQAHIARLARCYSIVAECVAANPNLVPVFERIEAELESSRAAVVNDPIARARRIAEQRRAKT